MGVGLAGRWPSRLSTISTVLHDITDVQPSLMNASSAEGVDYSELQLQGDHASGSLVILVSSIAICRKC